MLTFSIVCALAFSAGWLLRSLVFRGQVLALNELVERVERGLDRAEGRPDVDVLPRRVNARALRS
jgi:hypothetical protein